MSICLEDILYKKALRLTFLSFFIFLGLVLSPYQSSASYITVQTQATPSYDGKQFKLQVSVTNKGDEPAYNVTVSADINGKLTSSPAKEVVGVNETYSLEMTTDLTLEKAGRYPVVVNVDYSDANRYPFSASSITHFAYKDNLPPIQIFGTLQNIEISKSGGLKLTVKNLDDKEKKAMVRLVLPKELSASNVSESVSLKGRSEDQVKFKIKNFSALPGSTYSIFAVIGYDEGNFHYSTSISSSVRVVEDPGFVASNRPLLIGVTIALAIGFLYLNFRAFTKKRRMKSSP